jgi:hypothetical protein
MPGPWKLLALSVDATQMHSGRARYAQVASSQRQEACMQPTSSSANHATVRFHAKSAIPFLDPAEPGGGA